MNNPERKTISIRSIPFDDVSPKEALSIALSLVRSRDGKPKIIHTPNAEMVQMCVGDPEMTALIRDADLIVPDGSGVILASRILGKPLKKGKVAGVELGEALVRSAAKEGLSLFLLGGKPGVAETAAKNLTEKYPGLIVCGTQDGYFKEDEPVISKINEQSPDLLFVCLGVPKQEKWMRENREKLNAGLMAGLGGSLDIYAGTAKRAPKLFLKLNLEWLYRLLCEPKRIGRMMQLPVFLFGVIGCRLRGTED